MILQIKLISDARFEENKEYDVLYDDTLQQGYTDVDDSIIDWDRFGGKAGKDYEFVREEIKTLAGDLSGLTTEEKEVAAQRMCPSPSDSQVISILGNDYDKYLDIFINSGRDARLSRWYALQRESIKLIVEYYKLMNELSLDVLSTKYVNGIESNTKHGFDGIIDFLKSQNSYSGAGLISGGYTPIDSGNTITDVSNMLVDIVQNGNYS